MRIAHLGKDHESRLKRQKRLTLVDDLGEYSFVEKTIPALRFAPTHRAGKVCDIWQWSY